MLSIIITHYKTPILLKLCLQSVKENIAKIKFETIVVDSQTDGRTKELIGEELASQITLLSFKKNLGYARCVNAGLKKAKGEYILILNADILVGPGSISKMLAFIKENPQVGIVGPKLLGFNNKTQSSCFRYPSLSIVLARRTPLGKTNWGKKKLNHFLYQDLDLSVNQEVDWVQGSAIMTSKKAVSQVGLMDERFFYYLEDTDWCRRFWQNGYKVVYWPEVHMWHYHGRHSKKKNNFIFDALFNKYGWFHIINLFKFLWKWGWAV